MQLPPINLSLPDWFGEFFATADPVLLTVEDRMRLVIRLAQLNIENRTGGPFAAAVFERDSGKLIAPGVNLVIPANCSIAHAEIIALALAQQTLGTYDLAGPSIPSCELVTSTEPCAMCLGAVGWSGVRSLVFAAGDQDARAIGFDEGDKPSDWVNALQHRGIAVTRDILRPQAVAVLEQYQRTNGQIYNPTRQ